MKSFTGFKKISFIFVSLLIVSCANFNSAPPASPKQPQAETQPKTLEDFINNKDSMTKALQSLSPNFTVELLKNGIISNNYVRISSLKLDNTPVIVAIVSTNVTNSTFVTILRNANTTPIGKMLFAKDSGITRSDMKVNIMIVQDVKNEIAHSYLNKIGYTDKTHIVARDSVFTHDKETLNITEYVLPSMTKYFKK